MGEECSLGFTNKSLFEIRVSLIYHCQTVRSRTTTFVEANVDIHKLSEKGLALLSPSPKQSNSAGKSNLSLMQRKLSPVPFHHPFATITQHFHLYIDRL